MYEQSASFDRNDLNQSTSLYLRALVALVLSRDPRDQCGVDVMPYRLQSRRGIGSIVLAIPSFFEIKELDGVRKLSEKNWILFFRSPR